MPTCVRFPAIEHPIIAIEWAEETDLEFSAIAAFDHFGFAGGLIKFAVQTVFEAGIDDFDFAIIAQGIVRRYPFAPDLKGRFVPAVFVPFAKVGWQRDGFGRLRHGSIANRARLTDASGKGERKCGE